MARAAVIQGMLLSTFAATSLAAQIPVPTNNPTYPAYFGVSGPIIATGNQVDATYYGWEATTYYGHEVWALTTDDYSTDLADGCFAWVVDPSTCAAIAGDALFGKSTIDGTAADPYLAAPEAATFDWTPNTEIIFAIQVLQGDGTNWFFSGDPTRNTDNLPDLAYFSASDYPDGVPAQRGVGLVPQTAGLSLFGFEDVNYANSDWDFNNSIFAIADTDVGIPTGVVPEPATLTLLAGGLLLVGAGTLLRRRAASAA